MANKSDPYVHRWPEVRALFEAALAIPGAERDAFVRGRGDAWLAERVLTLLVGEPTQPSETGSNTDSSIGDLLAPWLQARDTHDTATTGEPGTAHIGPYRVMRLLGEGGMGSVYLAERVDGAFAKLIALKVVRDRFSPEQRRRFQTERELLAKLEHPGIARVLDGGETDSGLPWMAMEYVQGLPLNEYVLRQKPSLRERLNLLCKLADAVQYAHQNLVVHRDLKPGNVIVQAGGEPKLLDFGIAKNLAIDQTKTATRAPMTFAYAAPEQIKGETVSTATDVYALGVMLYELLTGERPHKLSGDSLSLLQAVTDTDATAPSTLLSQNTRSAKPIPAKLVRGDLDTICLKALSRDPKRRYPSAQAFAFDLQAFLADRPIQARPDSTRYLAEKWLRRNRGFAALGLFSILSIVAGIASVWHQAQIATREAALANSVRQVLSGMFLDVDPQRRSSGEISVKFVLDEALLRVERELSDSPDLRLPVTIDLGRAYFNVVDQARGVELLKATFLESRNRSPELLATAALYYALAATAFGRPHFREEIDSILQPNPFQVGSNEWFDAELFRVLRMDKDAANPAENISRQIKALRELQAMPSVTIDRQRSFDVRKNIASRLSALGEYDAADAEYVELIDEARTTQSPLRLAALLHNRALSTERPRALKLSLLEETIDIYHRELGSEHFHTLNARNIRAGLRMSSGEPEGFAEAQAVIVLQRTLDGTHVVASLLNLSNGYRKLRQCSPAMRAVDEAKSRSRALELPPEHAFSTGAAFAEIECQIATGEWEKAQSGIALQRELRTRLGQSLESIDFAQALVWRERAQADTTRTENAEKVLRQIQIYLDAEVGSYFGARIRLLAGESALDLGRLPSARLWLSEAFDYCEKNAPVDLAFCARSQWQFGALLMQSSEAMERQRGATLRANAAGTLAKFLTKDDPWRARFR